jgi:long-chain fatty acid transport protein
MATNGTNMTGVGAQSSAMGGTGVAAFYGAETVIVNPAMIGKTQGTEFSFGGTLFKPEVKNDGLPDGTNTKTPATSTADTFLIPSVSLASRINDNLTFGIGMYGTSGMGVDYSSNTINSGAGAFKQFEAQSNLQIMRFVPTLAYNESNFGIGFSPIIQYGALDINYRTNDGTNDINVGKGMSSDLGYGYSIGGYFDATKDLTVAASYTSAISMKYDGQLSGASQPFKAAGALSEVFSDTLEQPAELKAGIAYNMGNITLTGDFKQIRWGEAKGYKDFGWEDQNVIALGAKYQGNGFWLGAGYNKGDNPIKKQNGTGATAAAKKGAVLNMFNNVFFPATTEQHYSIGGGYSLTKNVALDAAIVIAPEVETSVVVSDMMDGTTTNTTKHSQQAYTVSVRYNF